MQFEARGRLCPIFLLLRCWMKGTFLSKMMGWGTDRDVFARSFYFPARSPSANHPHHSLRLNSARYRYRSPQAHPRAREEAL